MSHAGQQRRGQRLRPIRADTNEIQEDGTILLYSRTGDVVAQAFIDVEDIPRVSQHRWVLRRGSSTNYVSMAGTKQPLHRWLMSAPDDLQVDHIDGNGLNNRRFNLRLVTFVKQMQNKKSWAASQNRNVYFDRMKQLWRVIVTLDGVKHQGGRFKNKADAIAKAKSLRAQLLSHHNEERHPAKP